MSHASTTWAMRLSIEPDPSQPANFDLSKLKWLLVAIADCEQGTGEAFASIALLSQKTQMDRKTVPLYLGELQRRQYLRDTGRRVGRTRQVPVYELVGFDSDAAFARRQMERQIARKTPAEGVLSNSGNSKPEARVQDTEVSNEFDAPDGIGEQVVQSPPSAGTFGGSERTPAAGSFGESPPPKDPAGGVKDPRRRATEHGFNHESGARAHARGRARDPDPESERKPDLGAIRRWWASAIRNEIQDVGAMHLPGSAALWPVRSQLPLLRGTAAVSARQIEAELVESFIGRELAGEDRKDLDSQMRRQVYEALLSLRQNQASAA